MPRGMRRRRKDAGKRPDALRPEPPAAADLARAYLYRAELAVRTNDLVLARSSLAAAQSVELGPDERTALAGEFSDVAEPVDPAERPS